MAADLGDLIARVLLDSKEFNAGMKGVEQQAQETADKAGANLGGLSEGITSIASAAAGLAAAFGLEKFGEAALEAAAKTDKLAASFAAINGPSEETNNLFEDLSALEFKSLFDFEDTLGPAAKNMLTLGVSADQTKETMTALVDAAAGLKEGPEWIERVSGSIATMQSHLVASVRDMKGLQKEGVDAWARSAREIGTSVPEAMAKVKAGLVESQTVTKAVTKEMATRFDGAAERSMGTWKGAMHILDESTEDAMVAIGRTIREILNEAKPIIEGAATAVKKFTEIWAELPGPLKDALVIVPGLAVAIGGAAAAFTGLGAAMALLEFNPVVLGITAAVAALALIGKWAYDNWPAIKAVFTEATAYLSEVFSPLITIWKTEWEAITGVLGFAWESIKKGTGDLIEGVSKVIGFVGDMVSHLPFSDELKKLGSLWESEQAKMTAVKVAAEEKKKADDEAAAASARLRKEAAATEAREVAAAAAAKIAAEERKKAAKEYEDYHKRMDTADEKFQASQKKNEDAFTKAYNGMKKAVEETGEVTIGVFERLGGENSPMAVAIKRFGDAKYAMEKLGYASTQVLTQGVKDAENYADKVKEAYEHGQASASDYGAAVDAVTAKQKALKEYTERDLTNAWKELGVTTTASLTEIAEKAEAAYERVEESGTATAEDLYNAWEDVKKKQQAVADNANKELTDAYHSLGVKSAAEMTKLATDAEAAYQKIARDAGTNSIAAKEAWVKAHEDANAAIVAAGGQLTRDQKEELSKRKTQLEEELRKQEGSWGESYGKVKGIVGGAFDEMVAKLVQGDLSFAGTIKKMWEDLATAALDQFLKPVKEAITTFISTAIADLLSGKGLGGVLDSLTKIGSAATDLFTGGAEVASGAGAVAGGAGSAAGAGGGAAAGIGAGLSSIVGAVAGVVTAISSIIGNFQMAKQETSLNAIEHNTRYSMMYLGERSDGGILGVLFKTYEEIAWGAQTKAAEQLRDMFNDWRGHAGDNLALCAVATAAMANDTAETVRLLSGMSGMLAEARDALTTGIPSLLSRGFESLNVTVTATGVTTVEAARKLGDQIAANLSRQLVQVS